jgi:hypothetical protein
VGTPQLTLESARKPARGTHRLRSATVVDEQPYRYYNKEEEFLGEFYNLAPAAALAVGNEWLPRNDCDDGARQQQRYFLSTGELSQLVFDGAEVYRSSKGFSSAVIFLRSSKRLVSVRVRPKGKSYVAKVEVDRVP